MLKKFFSTCDWVKLKKDLLHYQSVAGFNNFAEVVFDSIVSALQFVDLAPPILRLGCKHSSILLLIPDPLF